MSFTHTIQRFLKLIAVWSVATLISTPGPTLADPVSSFAGPATGVFTTPANSADVDSARGALTYAYNFELPAARGLAQPRLSLKYNSASGDAEAGYGWTLDLPKIENRPLSGWPDPGSGGAAGKQRFEINGRALVAVCTTGALNPDVPPCDPDLLLPTWVTPGGSGWIYYREQNDRSFSRYFLSPDRATWRVQVKGGIIQEFGQPLQMASLTSAAYETDNGTIVRWRLVREYEAARPQNIIVYRWRSIGKRGLLYLTDMWDTPRANETADVRRFAHHAQLGWVLPGFKTTAYASRLKSAPDMVLSAVGVTSANWEATQTRDVIRLYNLVYMKPRTVPLQSNDQAPLFQHSFLQAIGMQGRCDYRETDEGNLPRLINCLYQPLTTFTYQKPQGDAQGGTSTRQPGYNPGSFGGPISKVTGADPDIAQRNGVLPYINSAAVVDFNRDGLPDLVQAWEGEQTCFGQKGRVVMHTPVDGSPAELVCITQHDQRVIRSARPMVGWLNNTTSLQTQFAYQCMDAGTGARGTLPWFIRQSLDPNGKPRLTSFLSAQGASTIVGSFGDGPVIWGAGEAGFRPFKAVPVSPESAFCDKPDTTPGWRWEPGSFDPQAWPRGNGRLGVEDAISGPRWFADIDGDGLVDQLGSATGSTFNAYLDNATPLYTRQYAAGERVPTGGVGPAQVPFVSPGNNNALVPSMRAPAGTRFFYTDVNADGLTDLAYFPPAGPLVVRPGDGRGNFGCDTAREPLGCNGDEYQANTPDAAPWTTGAAAWNPRFERYLHDVNGDGLADIVIFRDDTDPQLSGLIQLWINVDGHTFRCATAPAAVPCIVGRMVDDVHGSTRFGAHRVDFADMDGNGIDDMVLVTQAGAAITQFEPVISISDFGAPRLGLLTRVNNGIGAVTDVKYATLAQLMARAQSGKPWRTVVPTPALVVDTIRTHNDLAPGASVTEPLRFSRRKVFTYRDPAYDTWKRAFLGFRQVDVQTGDEYAVTRTLYWFGPCQQPAITQQCLEGSDNDPEGARTGLPVRIDRIIPGNDPYDPQELLSSTDMFYENRLLIQRDNERAVRTAFLVGRETRVYAPKGPFGPGLVDQGGGGDVRRHSPTQAGAIPVAETASYDNQGNLVMTRKLGRVADGVNTGVDSPPGLDPVIVSWHGSPTSSDLPGPMRCDRDLWICFDEAVTTTTDKTRDHSYQTLRKKRFGYTRQGEIAYVEGWLNPAYAQLARHHASSAAVAPLPVGLTSGAGWHRLVTASYDETYGGLARQQMPGDPAGCTGYFYDPPFRQFVTTTREYYAGCDGRALERGTAYERAYGLLSRSVGPAGETTGITY